MVALLTVAPHIVALHIIAQITFFRILGSIYLIRFNFVNSV